MWPVISFEGAGGEAGWPEEAGRRGPTREGQVGTRAIGVSSQVLTGVCVRFCSYGSYASVFVAATRCCSHSTLCSPVLGSRMPVAHTHLSTYSLIHLSTYSLIHIFTCALLAVPSRLSLSDVHSTTLRSVHTDNTTRQHLSHLLVIIIDILSQLASQSLFCAWIICVKLYLLFGQGFA